MWQDIEPKLNLTGSGQSIAV